jgi:hypothetical protein
MRTIIGELSYWAIVVLSCSLYGVLTVGVPYTFLLAMFSGR